MIRRPPRNGRSDFRERLVAAPADYSPAPTASPRLITPHLLFAAGQSLPADVVEEVRRTAGVKDLEIVDAARALVAGKRLGVLGVDPAAALVHAIHTGQAIDMPRVRTERPGISSVRWAVGCRA
jgi:hypothetical protein